MNDWWYRDLYTLPGILWSASSIIPVCDIDRKLSNKKRTKYQNLNDFGLVLKSFSPNPLEPGVKSGMKM